MVHTCCVATLDHTIGKARSWKMGSLFIVSPPGGNGRDLMYPILLNEDVRLGLQRSHERISSSLPFPIFCWFARGIFFPEPMEECPYDPHHRVPVRTMEKHKISCKLKKMGYSAEEQAEMYDPSVCYENTSVRSFTMDKTTQHQVILQARSAAPMMRMEGVFWQGQYSGEPVDVPQNHKRAVCDLTVADRLALYNHVVGVINQQKEASSSNDDLYVDLVSKLQKDEEQNEPKTKLELMAEMRDYKRRRQSYRAKNVHITKKSYTEVIREVISVHSEELARQWKEEEDEEESMRVEQSSHGRQVDERRSPSSESHHSHNKRHRSRERSHERESKKKKSRRERDSHSPDDHHHHHDKKKKKKKKKDERDREKEK